MASSSCDIEESSAFLSYFTKMDTLSIVDSIYELSEGDFDDS